MLIDSAAAAVVADARIAVMVDHRCIVRVVDHRHIHVVQGAVVIKVIVLPSPAFIRAAEVTELVIYPSIESHTRTPIALVKIISPAAPGPIGRRPKESRLWREHPGPRDPVIIVAIPRPISGCPDVSLARADRLLIDRQLWRAERNGDSYANLSVSRSRQKQQPHETQ